MSRWGNGLLATRGEVIAIGPLVDSVKVGEVVDFSDSCGKLAEQNGVKYLIIREDDVMFIEDELIQSAEWIGAMEVATDVE